MAPKNKIITKNEQWFQAYYDTTKYKVEYELEFGGDTIKPGDKIKVKHQRGDYKFRCVVHCPETNITWFDCIEILSGSWHSFYLDKLKGAVKPRRIYRKRK